MMVLFICADENKQLHRVGLCAGSGGDLVSAALAQGADAFVTGEMRHHDALAAAAKGLTVICTLHSNRCGPPRHAWGCIMIMGRTQP